MCPLGGSSSSIGKAKCISDGNCRAIGDSAMFVNQFYPHCPFLFLQPSRPIKSHTQLRMLPTTV
ncbi:unnamed protein product [Hymenolepis diminuta]|uniref:Uncharacterized protein n=1 Tax=Hymenolepis diminuta TaxID=6216 RepID=A0A564Z4W3_HYMDI|nr:unnamed protein product [Hymenolepis diminuta]